jgi:hypothetical protein
MIVMEITQCASAFDELIDKVGVIRTVRADHCGCIAIILSSGHHYNAALWQQQVSQSKLVFSESISGCLNFRPAIV